MSGTSIVEHTAGMMLDWNLNSYFADVVKLLQRKLQNKEQILFVGNGGSAAIASHMAIDFMNKGGFNSRCFNDAAALTCLSNDYGYKEVFGRQLHRAMTGNDVLIAISSSGESDNIIHCAELAQTQMVPVVTLTGFDGGNRLQRYADYRFHVPSENYGIIETAHLGLLHALLDATR